MLRSRSQSTLNKAATIRARRDRLFDEVVDLLRSQKMTAKDFAAHNPSFSARQFYDFGRGRAEMFSLDRLEMIRDALTLREAA